MSATATTNRLATFLHVLRKYRLVEPAKLEKLEGNPLVQGDDPRPLARQLGQWGWLTRYQLQVLAAGKVRELVVGPYRILDCLGEGGMGEVYKARHLTMNRLVALKVIRKAWLSDERQVKRFYQEVQAAAQLVHPHIMVAFDAGCADGQHYLAMEFAEGCDLSRLVKENGPLPVNQACEYIQQAALGLQYAHERGLVHRDIKPSNLFLARPPQSQVPEGAGGSTRLLMQKPLIKILDLGLARFQNGSDSDPSLTRTGMVVGTPDYIAPEQAQNSRAVDIRSDLYSLGCTFYFLLAGRPPFEAQSAMDVMLLHYTEEATPIEQWRPDVPREVCAILRKLLAKQPEQRFQTPSDLAAALEPFTGGPAAAPVLATPAPTPDTSTWQPFGVLAARRELATDRTDLLTAPSMLATRPPAPGFSLHQGLLLFLIPIVAMLLVIGVWLLFLDRAEPFRPQPAPTIPLVEKPAPERAADVPARPVQRRQEKPAALGGNQAHLLAFQLRNMHVEGGPFQAGETVTIRYELVNASAADLQIPEGKLGIRQHWLERMGNDPLMTNLGRAARIGNRYAAGGLPIRVEPMVLAGKSFPYVRKFSTEGFPPGRYRYHVEYQNDQKTVLHTLWVEFEVLPPRHPV
jgi:serine/threonine-protein kinase